MKIGKLASATGVSVRAIRHYDDFGLLQSRRTENGYRTFDDVAATQVRQIQRLVCAGFSLEDIATFPECMILIDGAEACPEIRATHRRRMQKLEEQISELQLRRDRMRALLA